MLYRTGDFCGFRSFNGIPGKVRILGNFPVLLIGARIFNAGVFILETLFEAPGMRLCGRLQGSKNCPWNFLDSFGHPDLFSLFPENYINNIRVIRRIIMKKVWILLLAVLFLLMAVSAGMADQKIVMEVEGMA